MSESKIGEAVKIKVDCREPIGELNHLWASIGFDEINWSYTPRGKRLLETLGREVLEQPYYVRNHNAFTSGNGLSYPAGGSTNVYREDADGQPIYNWEIVDQIYDAYVANNCRPLIELGFLPFDLVPEDEAAFPTFGASHDLGKEPYENSKWKLPPKDFTRWEKLVEAFVSHLVERFGADEVANWYFELWNEPDIPNYWHGSVEDYCRLYDHSVAGARRAFPQVKIGGPATTDHGDKFLHTFLAHCVRGRNYITGETGTPLDFISFHTKGAAFAPRRSYGHPVKPESPSLPKMLNDIRRSLTVVAQFPELHHLPVFVDECDPAVGTIYGVYDNPNFVVCNSEYYPTFVAAMVGQILQLNQQMPAPVTMITHWAFYFEGKRYFEGNRTLVTNNNTWKPIVAGLKMLGRLGRKQLKLNSSATCSVLDAGFNPQTHLVDGLATVQESAAGQQTYSILLWHHCDDWATGGDSPIQLQLEGLGELAGKIIEVQHWRIDSEHSNAHTEWLRQGRPEEPDEAQLKRLQAAQQLAHLKTEGENQAVTSYQVSENGIFELSFNLPTHALSLLEITQVGATSEKDGSL